MIFGNFSAIHSNSLQDRKFLRNDFENIDPKRRCVRCARGVSWGVTIHRLLSMFAAIALLASAIAMAGGRAHAAEPAPAEAAMHCAESMAAGHHGAPAPEPVPPAKDCFTACAAIPAKPPVLAVRAMPAWSEPVAAAATLLRGRSMELATPPPRIS